MTIDIEAIKARAAEFSGFQIYSDVVALVAEVERLARLRVITDEAIARIDAEHGAGGEWCDNPVRGAVSAALGLLRCRIALAGKESDRG